MEAIEQSRVVLKPYRMLGLVVTQIGQSPVLGTRLPVLAQEHDTAIRGPAHALPDCPTARSIQRTVYPDHSLNRR